MGPVHGFAAAMVSGRVKDEDAEGLSDSLACKLEATRS